MNKELSAKEKKFIQGIQNISKRKKQNYTTIGLLYGVSIMGLSLGAYYRSKDGFFMALFFGSMATLMLVIVKVYEKLSDIIKKLL